MNPYISVVLAARNDNYGENFLLRLNTFIKSLDHQTQTYPDLVELVIVEWNPPNDTQPLFEVIERSCNYKTRVITVPNETHQTFQTKLPMLEFQAKNVGARRANGQFVLVTNPDILFSQELIDRLARRTLSSTVLYRTDRYDYKGNGIENISVEKYTTFALENIFTVHMMKNEHAIAPKIENQISVMSVPGTDKNSKVPHTNACGDFMLLHKDGFILTKGLIEITQPSWHLDSYSLYNFLGTGYEQELFVYPECIFHMDHERRMYPNSWNQELADKLKNRQGRIEGTSEQWGLGNILLPEWSRHL